MSQSSVKTIRTGCTKWSKYKERSFSSTYHSFLNFFFQSLITSYKELIGCTTTKISIFILSVSTGVLFKGAFPLSILKNTYFARIPASVCNILSNQKIVKNQQIRINLRKNYIIKLLYQIYLLLEKMK